jgi:hypothetical protein
VEREAMHTGDAAVDAALADLATLDARPLREHVTVVDAAQAALADLLEETDA